MYEKFPSEVHAPSTSNTKKGQLVMNMSTADGSVSNVLPLEARLRNLTYAAPIYLDRIVEEDGIVRESQS